MEGVAGVVEGPSPLVKNGKVFIAYSASATDSRYKLGLLSASDTADLLNTASWYKRANPVFQTANGVYGPGHGSFTVAEDNTTDMLVYHARDYANPTPDALTDPNRHTRMQQLYWRENGDPFFGQPIPSAVTAPGIRGRHSNRCVDNYNFDTTPGALVRLYDCSGNTAQEFEFNYRGASGYEIRNRNTGTCLDDLNGSTARERRRRPVPVQRRRPPSSGRSRTAAAAGSRCATSPATCAWTTTTGTPRTAPASRSIPATALAAQLWRRG